MHYFLTLQILFVLKSVILKNRSGISRDYQLRTGYALYSRNSLVQFKNFLRTKRHNLLKKVNNINKKCEYCRIE